MDSIRLIGLLHPITVTQFGDKKPYRLRAGLHRLEACKQLGRKDIPATIVKHMGPYADLIEVDENLMQTTLDAAQRALFTARRKELYLAIYPETAKGAAQGEGKKRSLAEKGTGGQVGHEISDRQLGDEIPNQAHTFSEDTAAKTGRSERSIERDAERGEKIASDVLEEVSGTPLATGQTLDELKKLPPEQQRERVKEKKAAPAKPRANRTPKGKAMPAHGPLERKDTYDTKLGAQLEECFAALWQLSVDLQDYSVGTGNAPIKLNVLLSIKASCQQASASATRDTI
jgi:ParB family chromosome partitioning protein